MLQGQGLSHTPILTKTRVTVNILQRKTLSKTRHTLIRNSKGVLSKVKYKMLVFINPYLFQEYKEFKYY